MTLSLKMSVHVVKSSCDHDSKRLTLDDLPKEILYEILAHLSIQDRFQCRQLNRSWRQLSMKGINKVLAGRFDNEFWVDIPMPFDFVFKTDANHCNLFQLWMQEGKKKKL